MQAYCIICMFQLLSITGAMETSIVGGKEAKPHSRPYMASLQFNGEHRCGGMLIREDFILTAAHCKPNFSRGEEEKLTAVLGAHNVKTKEKSHQRFQVVCHQHPKFEKYDYDVMLLELKPKATLNKYVKTIDLPKKDESIPANTKCAVAGWGQTGKEISSKVLKEAKEMMQKNFRCQYRWQQFFRPNHMICTTFTKKTGGICQGDSGGPLICNGNLYGITAFTSKDCKDPKFPHVFTKVYPFLPWIKKVLQGFGDGV